MSTSLILWGIVLGAVVTWVPRVFPFILVKYRELPAIVVRFLQYLPVSILFALLLSSLVNARTGSLPTLKFLEILASIPTIFIAIRTKNLLWTVLVGVVSMAVLRIFV